ncbi:MAG: Hint domain-containing protein [Myxococcales bacterium]|nr:Hint domain-containing protein [Myxococcales bacterium]
MTSKRRKTAPSGESLALDMEFEQPRVKAVSLQEETAKRYLNYALSVVTSRALPDVRDGLKPVQRRILFAMFHNLKLLPSAKFRKSAAIVGECFVEGTLVTTPRGLVPIESLEIGDSVVTQRGVRSVTQTYVMPPQPLKQVRFRDGRSVTCTHGQAFKVLEPSLDVVWKEAKDLRHGDVVLGKHYPKDTPSKTEQDEVLSEKLAYVLGFFLADGWVDRSSRGYDRLAFACTDEAVLHTIADFFEEEFHHRPNVTPLRENMYALRVSRHQTNQELIERFGLREKYAENIRVPDAILRASRDVQMAFISGFLDGDGSVHKHRALVVLNSICRRFLEQVQLMLRMHGVFSRLLAYEKNNSSYQTEWALEICGFSLQRLAPWLSLQVPQKRERLEALQQRECKVEDADEIPFLGPILLEEFRHRHLGGGWYQTSDGQKVRAGLHYADGTKLRYSADLASTFRLSFSKLHSINFLEKMRVIQSCHLHRVESWQAQSITFAFVDSIEDVEPAITYDIQVEEEHEFVAEGLLVHNCMGKYHPHGDSAIYDAMVRMAQPFVLRVPLVDGYGNFGSIDGDRAAAMRYSEARLQTASLELLDELKHETVAMRSNFDGTQEEPVVLPAKFPQLLVNGCSGIAVGMATNIPPHNPIEVMDALLYLIDNQHNTNNEHVTRQLMKKIKGPDFPTGGEILASREELEQIYQEGSGNFVVRGEWKIEEVEDNKKIDHIIITSIPYNVDKSSIVEKIADVVVSKKLPTLLDVRDESTEEIRIVLEIKSKQDPEMIMAYLYKHTPLSHRFAVNMTVLVPTNNPMICAPDRLSLREMLEQFMAFRLEVLGRRLRCELERLKRRIHILEGFSIVFNDLDRAIKIIREADGRKDAGVQLQKHFKLSDEQTEAILDTRLYRISRLEINTILEELRQLAERAAEIEATLASPELMTAAMRKEMEEVKGRIADKRKTRILGEDKALEYDPEAFIQDEDTNVILSRDGWIKRIRTINDINTIRIRESDELLGIFPGSTKESICFFTNFGAAYTMRIWDVQATTGYGAPLQSLFKFKDGERVVGAITLDPRFCGNIQDPVGKGDDALPENHLLVVTQKGQGSRLGLAGFVEPSNKNGRRYARLDRGDQVLSIRLVRGDEILIIASEGMRTLMFPLEEIKFLGAAGKGVRLILLDEGDQIYAFEVSRSPKEGLRLEILGGKEVFLSPTEKLMGKRAAKGNKERIKGGWQGILAPPLVVPSFGSETSEGEPSLHKATGSHATVELFDLSE